MPNEAISQAVSKLQARKATIEKEIAEVDSQLDAVAKILNADEPARDPKRKPAASDDRGERLAANSGRKANRWFAAGEAVSLMKRHVRTPMKPSEIVKILARAKGFDQGLSGVQTKRFHATAYMAVANALKGGAASRLKDGRVRVA
jgi:hypothetical protein